MTTCACGCLEGVGKGKKFKAGHDQRLKGLLLRSAANGDQIELVCDGAKVGMFSPVEYGARVLTERGQAALAAHMTRPADGDRTVSR